MIKCEILFDEDKIIRDGEYTLESIQKATDDVFSTYHIKKDVDGLYVTSGADEDYVSFMGIIISLKRQQWFLDNISKWMLYVDEDDTGEFYTEDLIERYVIMRKGA